MDEAHTIDDFCSRFKIGRSQTYEEINSGRLQAVKLGRRTLISEKAAREWFEALPARSSAKVS